MSIPNTTPTPNELYNGEMKKMKDTELRVVLIVTRATLGWVIDKKTGMRKIEDWISHSQLIKKSGRGGKAISRAVDNCVKRGWIETRTGEGKLLKTAKERKMHGRKIYYRLGKVFLNRVNTIAKKTKVGEPSSFCPPNHSPFVREPWSKGQSTKETLTKERIITKALSKDKAGVPAKKIKRDSYLKELKKKQARPKKGNENINKLTSLLKKEMELDKLDDTIKNNRRYCNLAIRKFGVSGVSDIICAGAKDEFWKNQLTSFKAIYYNGVKISKTSDKPAKPYYMGMPMKKRYGKWNVLDRGEWKVYADAESKIKWIKD